MSQAEATRIAKAAERVRRQSRRSLKVLLPTAAAIGAGAAVAIGQIPGSGGTITACYDTVPQSQSSSGPPYGTLRVIDPSKAGSGVDPSEYQCASNEQTITWNQQGPPGQPGTPAQIVGESTFTMHSGRTSRVYMKLGGIPGDVFNKGEQLGMFALGAAGEFSGGEKVTLQTFQIDKMGGPDRAMYDLQHDYFTGQTLGRGEIVVENKADGKWAPVGKYDLMNMKVMDYQATTEGGQPMESVSFSFSKIKTEMGSGKNEMSTGWNTAQSLGGFDLTQQKAP